MPESCCSCEDIKKVIHDTVSELFDKRVEELKTTMQTTTKTRTKRAPSKYNIFIGECMKKPGENMKTCAAKYKQQKGKEPKKIEEGIFMVGNISYENQKEKKSKVERV